MIMSTMGMDNGDDVELVDIASTSSSSEPSGTTASKREARVSSEDDEEELVAKPVKKIKKSTRICLSVANVEELAERALNSRIIVPQLLELDQLASLTRKLGLNDQRVEKEDFLYPKLLRDILRIRNRKTRTKDRDGNSRAPGEYDVEEIIDGGLDDDGNEEYKVRWKNWEGDDTWEPVANLGNCWDLVKKYHDRQRQITEGEPKAKCIELNMVLNRLLTSECPDIAILLKLANKRIKDWTGTPTMLASIKKSLKAECHLLLDYLAKGVPDRMTDTSLLNITVKKLGLATKFGSLDGFLRAVEDRKDIKERLQHYEDEINARIKETGDGPLTTVENLVDGEIPEDFFFTAKYIPKDIHYSEEAVVHCDCTDCYSHTAKDCCIKECHRKPYNRDGTLLLDPQQAIYECNSKCGCGIDCPYKVVSKGRSYKLGIFRTDNDRGWGLKALEKIPRGKFVTTYMGQLITVDEAEIRNKNVPQLTYLMDLDYNPDHEALFSIDAAKHGNLSRFINHSVMTVIIVTYCNLSYLLVARCLLLSCS